MRADPLERFHADRAAARDHADPSASLCTFVTIDQSGDAQARTLVLRLVDGQLAVFFNATSPKFGELAHTDTVVLVTYFPSSEIQHRLRCSLAPIAPEIVRESWLLRPDAPKHLDWLYTTDAKQSSELEDRAALMTRLARVTLPDPLVAPVTACGFYLEPLVIERLVLDPDRGYADRHRFTRTEQGWHATTLVP